MEIPAWVVPLFEQVWSFVAVALAVNALGSMSKHVADKLGWRRYRRSDVAKLVERARTVTKEESSGDVVLPADASWYDVTLRAHPLVTGALFGLLPLPTLHMIEALKAEPDAGPGAVIVARCFWFMLAGALSGQIYELVKFAFTEGRGRLASLFGRFLGTAPASAPATVTVAAPGALPPPKDPPPPLADQLEPDGDRVTPDLSSNEDR